MTYFLVFMAVSWLLISCLLFISLDWRELAKKYRRSFTLQGSVALASISGGFIGYGGLVLVNPKEEGLGLALLIPPIPGLSPLFLPWQEVTDVQDAKRRTRAPAVDLLFASPVRPMVVTLYKGTLEQTIRRHWAGHRASSKGL